MDMNLINSRLCFYIMTLLTTSTNMASTTYSYILPEKIGLQFFKNLNLFPGEITIAPHKSGNTFNIETSKKPSELSINVGEAVTGDPLSISVSKKANLQFTDLTVTAANDQIISVTDCQGQVESNQVKDVRCVIASHSICSEIQKQKLSLIKRAKSSTNPEEQKKIERERQNKISECQSLSSEYAQILRAVNTAYGNRTIENQINEIYKKDTVQLNSRIKKMGLTPETKFLGAISNTPSSTANPDTNLGLIKKFEESYDDMRAVNRLFDICEKQPQFTRLEQTVDSKVLKPSATR